MQVKWDAELWTFGDSYEAEKKKGWNAWCKQPEANIFLKLINMLFVDERDNYKKNEQVIK